MVRRFYSVLQIPGKGAEVSTEVQDGTRRTALHAAAQMGFASVVQKLGMTFDVSVLGVAGFFAMVCVCVSVFVVLCRVVLCCVLVWFGLVCLFVCLCFCLCVRAAACMRVGVRIDMWGDCAG